MEGRGTETLASSLLFLFFSLSARTVWFGSWFKIVQLRWTVVSQPYGRGEHPRGTSRKRGPLKTRCPAKLGGVKDAGTYTCDHTCPRCKAPGPHTGSGSELIWGVPLGQPWYALLCPLCSMDALHLW